MKERETSDVANGWVIVSVTETGCRDLLLISLCDLGQDTDFSGSQTPGHSRSMRTVIKKA